MQKTSPGDDPCAPQPLRHPSAMDATGKPRIVRIDTIPEEPWKNGGGTTRVLGAGAGWRVSLATVSADGPFSRYPDAWRHSVVISGTGIQLSHGDDVVHLQPDLVATYRGDVLWDAHLQGAAAQVLNVMSEQDVVEARVQRADQLRVMQTSGTLLLLPVRCCAYWSTEKGDEARVAEGSVLVANGSGFSLIRSRVGRTVRDEAYVVVVQVAARGIITAASHQHQF